MAPTPASPAGRPLAAWCMARPPALKGRRQGPSNTLHRLPSRSSPTTPPPRRPLPPSLDELHPDNRIMPGKVAPSVRCALCDEAAICFCVNDDAHLCAGCDVKMHSANPLLARHERRPISALACQAECASAAPSSAPATSHSTDCDVGVVPQLTFAAPAVVPPAPAAPVVAEPAPVMAAPLDLYEDSFLGRSLTTSDLLDLDELELPGSGAFFDPLDDCVVPSFDAELRPASGDRHMDGATSVQSSFLSQPPAFVPSYLRHAPYMKQQQQQPVHMVPLGMGAPAAHAHVAAVPQAGPGPMSAADAEAEAARVQRHRERQRKKRAFGRAVRYQSRRAYAEIRPRIKGRFVTPEEYAAYQAQQAAIAAGEPVPEMAQMQEMYAAEPAAAPEAPAAAPAPAVAPKVPGMMGGYMAPPAVPAEPIEEDAVVPMPAFVMA